MLIHLRVLLRSYIVAAITQTGIALAAAVYILIICSDVGERSFILLYVAPAIAFFFIGWMLYQDVIFKAYTGSVPIADDLMGRADIVAPGGSPMPWSKSLHQVLATRAALWGYACYFVAASVVGLDLYPTVVPIGYGLLAALALLLCMTFIVAHYAHIDTLVSSFGQENMLRSIQFGVEGYVQFSRARYQMKRLLSTSLRAYIVPMFLHGVIIVWAYFTFLW